MPFLTQLFERWQDEQGLEDFGAYRLAAREKCKGMTEIWEQPFHVRYEVQDGELILRFRDNGPGVDDVYKRQLSSFYTPTVMDGRYTYVNGTSVGGLVVYDDKFAYSHHATDPSSGKLCNAFDLVRWHLFTPGSKTEDGTVIDSAQKSCLLYTSRRK